MPSALSKHEGSFHDVSTFFGPGKAANAGVAVSVI